MAKDGAELLWISVDALDESPENTIFRQFDERELAEFAESLREVGMVQPPVVRPKGERYEIVSGHQRVRAAKLLGWPEVLCVVEEATDEEALARLIDANIRGRIPGPMEIAKALARRAEAIGNRQGERTTQRVGVSGPDQLVSQKVPTSGTMFPKSGERTRDVLGKEFGMTGRQAEKYLRLNDLIPELQQAIESGQLDPSKGYELALLSPEVQKTLVAWRGQGLGEMTTAEVRELRQQLKETEAEKKRVVERLRQELDELKRRLAEAESRQAQVRVVRERDPAADREITKLRKQVNFLSGELSRLSTPVLEKERLEEELQRKRAEIEMLNCSLSRKQHSLAVSKMAEKLFGPLEREQTVFFEHLREAEFTPLTRAQLSKSLDLLRMFASRIEDALRTTNVEVAEYAFADDGNEERGDVDE